MPRCGNETSCLFGPVHSRRLGQSLGIDLIKFKTCTFNCVFCECGPTTALQTQRGIFVPASAVMQELESFFAGFNSALDVLTFSGGGEPTLAANLGEVIKEIKKKYSQYKLCLLTNSTLLPDPQVRAEILPVDITIASLNAVSEDIFTKINRPANDITSAKVQNGLLEFKQNYPGKLLLEIFIVPGLNDTAEELVNLRDFARVLKPNGIQLNSLDRPSAESWVKPATPEKMLEIKKLFAEFNTDYYLAK